MTRQNKNSTILKFLFFFLFILLFQLFQPDSGSLAKSYDPNLDWQVLESEHFSVIFPISISLENTFTYQQIAIYVAEIAEETYRQITPQFGKPFNSNQKIAIILEDFSDSTYGFASALPHRIIRLNLTAPGFKSFNTRFENWIKILLVHEYTHLAHFDMADKGTEFLRFFLGQVIAPNALQPLWAIEGLAIYNESKWTAGGRLEDSRYEMILRTDFQENQVKSSDQIQRSYLVSWPGGNAPYIYGQSLVHFIVKEYGEEKLIAVSEEFCAHPYLGMNRALKKTLGINQDDLFDRWQKAQNVYYQKQLEQVIQFSKITESQQLTNHHYWVDDPLWISNPSSGTKKLLYKVNIPELYPTIREYDQTTGKEKILIERTIGHGASYSLSPNQEYLIYSRLTQYKKYYRHYDLFLYNLKKDEQCRLTEGMRIKDPSWHPDQQQNKMIAVINQAGSNNLVLFSLDPFLSNNLDEKNLLSSSDLVYLSKFSDGIQISQPKWSPSGNQIAFSLWKEGYQDIYILALDNEEQILSITPVTRDHFADISPSWSPDGQYLFFSSDRSGIFNLYVYHTEKKQLYRLTNVTTGAFEPAVSPDGKEMAFIQYHASGYELHLTKTNQLLWKRIEKPIVNDVSIPLPVVQENKISFPDTGDGSLFRDTENRPLFDDYSPMDSLLPTYWTPYLTLTSNDLYIGFSSLAQDYLTFVDIPFTIAQGMLNQSLYYNIQLTDYFHEPIFSISLQGETGFSSQLETNIQFLNEGYTTEQDSGRYFTEEFSLGFQKKWYLLNDEQEENSGAFKRNLNSLILKYSYDDTERYSASISPEIGQAFSLIYQHASTMIGSDITFHKILFDGRKYFPTSRLNHVLALRLAAGISSNGLDEQEQFHLGGNQSDIRLSSVSSASFPLRGYPKNTFIGNRLFLSNLEFRFPIQKVEHKIGFDWASVFLERISGTLFLDMGHAWEDKFIPALEEMKAAIGAEINFKFKMADENPLTLSIGAGKPITDSSPYRFYAQFGISF